MWCGPFLKISTRNYLAVDEVLVPVEAGHDARESVGPGQHERRGHLEENSKDV